ncbi:hypothetical protein OQY15_02065 [Pedobacter sp. MC2016-15]|uniref:hypothetical protein n=1 Tax=Pedobacter sp. MC2016-15 TaxID=2994473 RepID=UPI002245A445|nr:hypothetical protein [Pedobacter sp. MC2016-15]MCX2477856.1 hypothetical protein [Pedobacter sp. MC2016-15]
MEQSNKELIKEIADLFEDYEESYVPGEWESFQKQQKKKYPFLPAWLKVAAVLLLIASAIPFGIKKFFQHQGNSVSTGQETVSVKKPSTPLKTAEPALNVQKNTSYAQKKASQIAAASSANVLAKRQAAQGGGDIKNTQSETQAAPVYANQVIIPVNPQVSAKPAEIIAALEKEQVLARNQVNTAVSEPVTPAAKDSTVLPATAKLSTAEFLLAESKMAAKKEKKKAAVSKWDFGLQVMPTATRTNVNFGGGIVTAYHVSDKISLSSGVSLVQLGSGENVPDAGPAMPANAAFSNVSKNAQGSRQLLTVDASIRAIDIPLGLVYKVNKHYYTSAGVSYFNVISEKRSNTYAETVPVSRMSTDPSTGAMESYTALETQQVDEVAPDRPLKGNGYLGFFNFSIGRRQNIFKQYNIQIEPFIKVPIGKLSTQDLNLMNSGVKFQLSF